MQNNSLKQSTSLVMLLPLMFILMPRPDISGSHFFTYPALALILAAVSIFITNNMNFNKKVINVITLFYFLTFIMVLSAVVNWSNISFNTLFHFAKPILFIIVLCFGYVVGTSKDYPTIVRGMLKSAYIILFFQIVIGLAQLYNISVFDFIYSDHKARPIGGLIRVTGTLANPNFFAWIVVQAMVIILLFEKKIAKKYIWLLLGVGLLLISGSRTFLLLFPLLIFFIKLIYSRKNAVFYFVKMPIYGLLLGFGFYLLYMFILKFGHNFPYLYQLLNIIETRSLDSIGSFDARLRMWEGALIDFNNSTGLLTWMFGMGPGTDSVVDNDYFYSMINYGVLGLFLNLLIYTVIYFQFKKLKIKEFSVLGRQYIVFSLIVGFQAESLGGWNYPIFILFYAGLAFALFKNQDEIVENIQEVVKKKRKRVKIVWSK